MGYHSLREWIRVFPEDLRIPVEVTTYGQSYCVAGLQRLRNPEEERDEELLEASV